MPVQRTCFGRPVPRASPRRIVQLLGLTVFLSIILIVFRVPHSSAVSSFPQFNETRRLSIPRLPTKLLSPSIFNPFRTAAHAPPVQENSTSGDASWYSNWNWMSPFSSSVTLDENRSLLPPLADRPPVYTYYDHTVKKDEETKAADNQILVTWRRAWWAQGFRPIILSPAEAVKNPLYEEVQRKALEGVIKDELLRWLAWESMGTGILCHYLTLPMGPRDDDLLSFLRRGEYPRLRRYEGLKSSIFSGSKNDITSAIKLSLSSSELSKSKDLIELLPEDFFKIDSQPESIASYDADTVGSKYPKLKEEMAASQAKGLKTLNELMNAHLHNVWQNAFPDGIIILKPCPHMTALLEPAMELAEFLAECPETPLASSCPPNRPKCKPCISSTPMKISTPLYFSNTSTEYVIGVLPHPYTMSTLYSLRENIDISYIRREARQRDTWLMSATRELLGTGVSSAPRLVAFKEAVASPHGMARSIWFTAEKTLPTDLDWYFGFAVSKRLLDMGKSETPVLGHEQRPPPAERDPRDGPLPSPEELGQEKKLLSEAVRFGKSKDAKDKRLREAVEMWNLADIEAWRFARAFLARGRVERLKWEEEEKKYAGGAGAERPASRGWLDKRLSRWA